MEQNYENLERMLNLIDLLLIIFYLWTIRFQIFEPPVGCGAVIDRHQSCFINPRRYRREYREGGLARLHCTHTDNLDSTMAPRRTTQCQLKPDFGGTIQGKSVGKLEDSQMDLHHLAVS